MYWKRYILINEQIVVKRQMFAAEFETLQSKQRVVYKDIAIN